MEIVYKISCIDELKKIIVDDSVEIRWLNIPNDYDFFNENLREQKSDDSFCLNINDWVKWEENGATYCGLFKNGNMIARAAVERYQNDTWETGDVRVWRSERGNGYAKQVCYFVTKFILENGKMATCRTEEDNIAMQNVIESLNFKPI